MIDWHWLLIVGFWCFGAGFVLGLWEAFRGDPYAGEES